MYLRPTAARPSAIVCSPGGSIAPFLVQPSFGVNVAELSSMRPRPSLGPCNAGLCGSALSGVAGRMVGLRS